MPAGPLETGCRAAVLTLSRTCGGKASRTSSSAAERPHALDAWMPAPWVRAQQHGARGRPRQARPRSEQRGAYTGDHASEQSRWNGGCLGVGWEGAGGEFGGAGYCAILTVRMVSWVYISTYQMAYGKCESFIVCRLYLDKAAKMALFCISMIEHRFLYLFASYVCSPVNRLFTSLPIFTLGCLFSNKCPVSSIIDVAFRSVTCLLSPSVVSVTMEEF